MQKKKLFPLVCAALKGLLNNMENQLFYVGQKAFIEKDGEVLVLMDKVGTDFPGGRINEGALNFKEELKREVREEASLEIEVGEPFYAWHSTFAPNGHYIFIVGYKCKYISGDVKISHEHVGYQWVNKDNYTKVEPKDTYYDALVKYFES